VAESAHALRVMVRMLMTLLRMTSPRSFVPGGTSTLRLLPVGVGARPLL
jgi:hypothetical protein